jgi:hypothetical protein
LYSASSWKTTTNNSVNWNTAYSWGDHNTKGYLTGGQVNSIATATPLRSCTQGQIPYYDVGDKDWHCTSVAANETDPHVGTLTDGKWCTANGTTINCTSDAPVGGSSSEPLWTAAS